MANRQSAQRSRVRKLQYISELERSVTSLQVVLIITRTHTHTYMYIYIRHTTIYEKISTNGDLYMFILKTEVSALSPRVAFLDHQRSVLTVGNSHLKQRIAALAQDKIFKDGQYLRHLHPHHY